MAKPPKDSNPPTTNKLTKKYRKQWCQDTIDAHEVGEEFSHEKVAEFSFMIGFELYRIRKVRNPIHGRGTSRHIQATFKNSNGFEYFSWVRAISGWSEKDNLGIAMRHAVQKHLPVYKTEKCARCGTCEDITVDHVTPFHTLKTDYIRIYKDNHLSIHNKNDGAGFVLVDDRHWVKYHNRRAEYQPLCRKCNSHYGKNQKAKHKQK